jgi:hypothetical protein
VIDMRARAVESHAVHRARPHAVLLGFLLAAAGASGCRDKADCTAELSDGKAVYKGRAQGRKGQAKLDRDAIRDACRQRCAADKAEMLDVCARRCLTDVEGARISARTTCSDR